MNIRWLTMAEQRRNQLNMEKFPFEGEMLCLTDIAKKIDMEPKTLYDRIHKQHLPYKEALTLPKWYDRGNKATKETKHQAAFDALLKKKQEEQK